jgi:hypothetical protein
MSDKAGDGSTAPLHTDASAHCAAAAKAPDLRGRVEDFASQGRRRSDRVLVGIPIEMSATDVHQVRFTVSCITEMVSLHGASVALPQRVSPDHPVIVRRPALDLEVHARILGQLGIRPGLHLYGVAFTEASPQFWGIQFPPDQGDGGFGRTLLMCSECNKQLIFTLNEIEFRVFEANQRLAFGCETCGRNVDWIPVPNEITTRPATLGDGRPQKRKHLRTRMKASACIMGSNHNDEVVEVLNVSRGGISFRGSRLYPLNGWIEFAVPYTRGAANIFVPGRIAWCTENGNNVFDHGVQYVRVTT